jgi:hypothetical protein
MWWRHVSLPLPSHSGAGRQGRDSDERTRAQSFYPRASTMAKRPLGDFNIPSPEMPSEGEQPSSAQKPAPEAPYDGTGNLPLRDKRRGLRRASTKLDEEECEEESDSSSESEQETSDEDNGDESDHENDQIKKSACATSSKELVPDSDDSNSDFLEDAPKKKQRLPRITDGSGGKVTITRSRRSWSEWCQFNISETSQTKMRNAFISSAVSDFLAGGTPEPTGKLHFLFSYFI